MSEAVMENFNQPGKDKPEDKNGTAGFSPQLAGHGKEGHNNTSGFNAETDFKPADSSNQENIQPKKKTVETIKL